MQQMVKKLLCIQRLVIVVCLFILASGVNVSEVQAATKAFEVITTIPDNQVDKDSTYFDLKLADKQEQTLEVVLRNITKKEITIVVGFNRQTTNSEGVIEYAATDDKPDKSLEVNIESLVTLVEEEIVLKPNSEETGKILVKAPDKEFSGELAGGLTFKLKPDDKQELSKKKTGNAGVENNYGYEVALIIHGNEPTSKLPSELKLSNVGVNYENGLNQIFANLQNPQAKFLYGVKIESKLTKKDSDDVLLKQVRDNLQVAPNSNFDYGMYLNGTVLEAGDYTLSLVITLDSEKVDFKKNFKIKQAEAEKILEESTPINQKNRTMRYLLIALISFMVLVIIWLVISQIAKTKNMRRIAKKKRKKRRKL